MWLARRQVGVREVRAHVGAAVRGGQEARAAIKT